MEELHKAIHRDFDGTDLGTEVIKNPPVRGLYGEAYIPLVEGAIHEAKTIHNARRKARGI